MATLYKWKLAKMFQIRYLVLQQTGVFLMKPCLVKYKKATLKINAGSNSRIVLGYITFCRTLSFLGLDWTDKLHCMYSISEKLMEE